MLIRLLYFRITLPRLMHFSPNPISCQKIMTSPNPTPFWNLFSLHQFINFSIPHYLFSNKIFPLANPTPNPICFVPCASHSAHQLYFTFLQCSISVCHTQLCVLVSLYCTNFSQYFHSAYLSQPHLTHLNFKNFHPYLTIFPSTLFYWFFNSPCFKNVLSIVSSAALYPICCPTLPNLPFIIVKISQLASLIIYIYLCLHNHKNIQQLLRTRKMNIIFTILLSPSPSLSPSSFQLLFLA